jgi:hypothetical protein
MKKKLKEFEWLYDAFRYVHETFYKKGSVGNKGRSHTVIVDGQKYRIVKTGNFTGNLSAYKVKDRKCT